MRLLPGQSFFEIKTTLSGEAVVEILRKQVTERHPLNPSPIPPAALFTGGVYGREFEIKEFAWLWRVYMPVFRGSIDTAESGSIIRVRASNAYTSFTVGGSWVFLAMFFLIGASAVFEGDFGAIVIMLFALTGGAIELYWTSWFLGKVESGKNQLQSLLVVKPTHTTIFPNIHGTVSNDEEDH